MDSREVTSNILEQAVSQTKVVDEEAGRSKFIFFQIGEVLYALPAEDVQEIMLDLTIHYLPFLPPFVRGLVNRLGEPVTVVDLQCLFNREILEGRTFLILKSQVSKMAFLIDRVQDIVLVPPQDVGKLSASTGNLNDFGLGMIHYRGKDVFLLDAKSVVRAVQEAVRA